MMTTMAEDHRQDRDRNRFQRLPMNNKKEIKRYAKWVSEQECFGKYQIYRKMNKTSSGNSQSKSIEKILALPPPPLPLLGPDAPLSNGDGATELGLDGSCIDMAGW